MKREGKLRANRIPIPKIQEVIQIPPEPEEKIIPPTKQHEHPGQALKPGHIEELDDLLPARVREAFKDKLNQPTTIEAATTTEERPKTIPIPKNFFSKESPTEPGALNKPEKSAEDTLSIPDYATENMVQELFGTTAVKDLGIKKVEIGLVKCNNNAMTIKGSVSIPGLFPWRDGGFYFEAILTDDETGKISLTDYKPQVIGWGQRIFGERRENTAAQETIKTRLENIPEQLPLRIEIKNELTLGVVTRVYIQGSQLHATLKKMYEQAPPIEVRPKSAGKIEAVALNTAQTTPKNIEGLELPPVGETIPEEVWLRDLETRKSALVVKISASEIKSAILRTKKERLQNNRIGKIFLFPFWNIYKLKKQIEQEREEYDKLHRSVRSVDEIIRKATSKPQVSTENVVTVKPLVTKTQTAFRTTELSGSTKSPEAINTAQLVENIDVEGGDLQRKIIQGGLGTENTEQQTQGEGAAPVTPVAETPAIETTTQVAESPISKPGGEGAAPASAEQTPAPAPAYETIERRKATALPKAAATASEAPATEGFVHTYVSRETGTKITTVLEDGVEVATYKYTDGSTEVMRDGRVVERYDKDGNLIKPTEPTQQKLSSLEQEITKTEMLSTERNEELKAIKQRLTVALLLSKQSLRDYQKEIEKISSASLVLFRERKISKIQEEIGKLEKEIQNLEKQIGESALTNEELLELDEIRKQLES